MKREALLGLYRLKVCSACVIASIVVVVVDCTDFGGAHFPVACFSHTILFFFD
jgi:hypothetical protein